MDKVICRWLKRIAALSLAVSFFLPLTQCSQKLGTTSPPVTVSASNAYEWPSILAIALLLLFFWPLVLQLWRIIKKRPAISSKASCVEFGLSVLSLAGTSWLVLSWVLTFGASIRYGAFVAAGSVLVYGVVSLLEAIRMRSTFSGRRHVSRPGGTVG
jgi:hypothetical protein